MATKITAGVSIRNFYAIGILTILGILMLVLFAPFFSIIVVAFVLVELFYPVYVYLNKLFRSGGISAILSTLIAFVAVIVPLLLILLLAAGEAVTFTRSAQDYVIRHDLLTEIPRQVTSTINDLLTRINVPSEFLLGSIDARALVADVGSRLGTLVGGVTTGILTGGLGLLFQAFLLILSMIYIFQLRSNLLENLKKVSPLDNSIDQLFYEKFVSTTQAVVKGTALVAVAQATAVSLVMVLMGVGSPVLLWIFMVLLSIIPVGSGLVWFPVGIVLIITGNPVQGIFLIVYSAIIINVIDAVLRPMIMRNSTQLHPLITLFSVLGGISVFGMIGILYGPLIAVLFTSLIQTFNQDKNEQSSVA